MGQAPATGEQVEACLRPALLPPLILLLPRTSGCLLGASSTLIPALGFCQLNYPLPISFPQMCLGAGVMALAALGKIN